MGMPTHIGDGKGNMTQIEWVLNPDNITRGITLNSKTGCLNGCPYCYARKLANGRLKQRYLANDILVGGYRIARGVLNERAIPPKLDPFYPRWWPERLEQIRKHKKPIGIFLDDMSDWMGDYWWKNWTEAELQVMRDCPRHRFYTLTKQPQNLRKFSPFPENCWVGVTATNPSMFAEACYRLGHIQAKVKFISFEPLLGFQPLPEVLTWSRWINDWLREGSIQQLIIGACTGTLNTLKPMVLKYPDLSIVPYGKIWTLQPKIEWVQEIVAAADKAGIAVFLKNNLDPLLGQDPTYKKWQGQDSEGHDLYGLRQETMYYLSLISGRPRGNNE